MFRVSLSVFVSHIRDASTMYAVCANERLQCTCMYTCTATCTVHNILNCHTLPLSALLRWVSFCHVPVFCESLQKYDATLIFGRTFLSSVFLTMRRQLMDRFTAEQDKMLPEKRTLVITHFPKSVCVRACVCVCACVHVHVYRRGC